MIEFNEYKIYQNHLIGAHALSEFARYYQIYNPKKEPPTLLLTLPVLPIVFNRRSFEILKNKQFKEGSLMKVISENKDIYLGLQDRMMSTVDLTMKSIYVAAAAKLIIYDRESTLIIPTNKNVNITNKEDYNKIISSSRRIGAWFGQLTLSEIMNYLNITF